MGGEREKRKMGIGREDGEEKGGGEMEIGREEEKGTETVSRKKDREKAR